MRICSILACLAWPQLLIAQVGLGTNVAQVTLVARVAPRASIEAVSPAREAGHEGLVREASVKVRLTANTGYRLVVWGTDAGNWGGHRGSRLWVRDADGHFQELASGSFVTAAQDARASGSEEHDVRFRIEGDSVDGAGESMPVRYEIVISPTI